MEKNIYLAQYERLTLESQKSLNDKVNGVLIINYMFNKFIRKQLSRNS